MSRREITLVQMNDSHAYLDLHPELFWGGHGPVYRPAGGYARVATLVRQIRAERPGRVLFCDGGDALHGTYPAVHTQGAALVPVLNALGLDATTAHWEFAYGPATLRRRAAELAYPLLAANVYDAATGARPYPAYAVRDIGGVRLAVIGLASNIVDKAMPPAFSAGLRFTLGRDELPPLIEQARTAERADLIVLLSHLGFAQDLKLVAEVDGIDVCLSAHTHNRVTRPARRGQTLVIQSGCHGSFLGRLDLVVEDGRLVDYEHHLLTVEADVPPDPAVADLVRQALTPYRADLAAVVGETATGLNRATTLEATTDNLLLHAIQAHTGAELAFSNGWRYGAPVPPGPVTLNDLYNIIPMNPPVSTLALTGDEVRRMLEESLHRTFAADPYEQMGGYVKRCLGLTAYVKLENPAGERIQHLFVGDDEIRPDGEYTAAFVTTQGVPERYGRQREAGSARAVDVLRTYLAAHRPVRAELRGAVVAV